MPIEDEEKDLEKEITSIVQQFHFPEHDQFPFAEEELPQEPPSCSQASRPAADSPVPETTTLNGENIVKGHLVKLRTKDGSEKVFFLDPQGQLHPVIGAQLRSPGTAAPVVKVASFISFGESCHLNDLAEICL